MRYPLGQPVYLSWTIKDRTGALVDAGAQTLVVTHPDATTVSYTTPTHDSTGAYHQDIGTADLPIKGHYQWVNTSTGTGAGVVYGEFDVFDPAEPEILGLQDAKLAVNIPQTTTTYDTELQAYVDTVTGSIEALTGGPAFNRTVTERVIATHNFTTLVVTQRPLVSVTSVTDVASGSLIGIADIELDPVAGIVRRKRNLPWFGWGTNGYTVVYVAGWGTVVPAPFNVAARIILQHLWKTQRGPGLAPTPNEDMTFLPGMGYAIPNRALELLRAHDPATGMPYLQEVYV